MYHQDRKLCHLKLPEQEKKKKMSWLKEAFVERLLQANNDFLIITPWAQEQVGTPLSWFS